MPLTYNFSYINTMSNNLNLELHWWNYKVTMFVLAVENRQRNETKWKIRDFIRLSAQDCET